MFFALTLKLYDVAAVTEDVRTSVVTVDSGLIPIRFVQIAWLVPESHYKLYESIVAPPVSVVVVREAQFTSI